MYPNKTYVKIQYPLQLIIFEVKYDESQQTLTFSAEKRQTPY